MLYVTSSIGFVPIAILQTYADIFSWNGKEWKASLNDFDTLILFRLLIILIYYKRLLHETHDY